MENIILIVVLVSLIGGAVYYIHKAKKRGTTCIGCPHAKTCQSHKCNCSCFDSDIDSK